VYDAIARCAWRWSSADRPAMQSLSEIVDRTGGSTSIWGIGSGHYERSDTSTTLPWSASLYAHFRCVSFFLSFSFAVRFENVLTKTRQRQRQQQQQQYRRSKGGRVFHTHTQIQNAHTHWHTCNNYTKNKCLRSLHVVVSFFLSGQLCAAAAVEGLKGAKRGQRRGRLGVKALLNTLECCCFSLAHFAARFSLLLFLLFFFCFFYFLSHLA